MHDLLIRSGTIVDSSCTPPFTGDVAIENGRIVAVGRVKGAARRTLDACGQLVTPGFVDIHTHYDGQATQDPLLTPSCWHRVTTAVMGNCGVGFAPMKSARRRSAASFCDILPGLKDGDSYCARCLVGRSINIVTE
jgi:N-acyl-D-aspartate/D-glutamate deacylase